MGEPLDDGDIRAAITAAKHNFDDAFAEVNGQLEADARSVTAPYFDPDRGHTRIIADAGRTLDANIREFASQRTRLLEARAEVNICVNQTLLSAEFATLDRVAVAVQLPSATAGVPALVGASLGLLSDLERQAAGAEAQLALRLSEVPKLLNLAAGLFALQQTSLGDYLRTQPRLDLTSVKSMVAAASVDEVRQLVLEEVVKQALKTVVFANPVTAVTVGVINIFESVAAEIRAEQAKTDRTPVDDMCDFVDRSSEINSGGDALLDGLRQTLESLTAELHQ